MTTLMPEPTALTPLTVHRNLTAEVRATLDVLLNPALTGSRAVLLGLLHDQLGDLYPIDLLGLRDDVLDWQAEAQRDLLAGVRPKHHLLTLQRVAQLLD